MAIEAELADGRILEFPDGTDPKVIQETVQRVMANPLAGMTTEKLKAIPSAPSTLRDINETAAMSLAGGIKGLSDLFGVDNTVSKYFGEKQTQALKQMTPERQREMQVEEELAKRAEGKPLEEFTTAGRAFLRSPAQGLVGGAMSSVPMIAATALAPAVTLPAAVTARLGTGIAGRIAGKAAAASPAIAVGAGMGVGSQKGQDYEAVKQAMLERGASEEEAEAAAQKAAEYSMQNAARQAASGIAGGLEGAIGVESVLGRMGRGRAGVSGAPTAPTWKGAAVQSTLGEAIPEAIQAGTGAIGTNVALQQAGFDRDLTAGVIGQVTNDALTGALLGTAVTPLQKRSMQAEFDRSQLERQLKEDQERQEKIDRVREQLGVDRQLLALPAPAQRIEEPPVTDVLNAPFGSFARNELPPEVVKYIDDHRAQMGRPGALPAYSIEDIKDAMPGINPEGEAAYIDSLLTAKSGYTGDITYNPKTVMDVAGQKNVATGTKGFADFLTRVTGVSDLNSMSQPQLHAAFTALTNLPNPEEGSTQTILPEGTNALRFSDDQFMRGYTAVLDEIAASSKNEVSPAQAIEAIKAASGIQNDADAKRVFDLSLKGGAIDVNKEGNVTAPAGIESLPAGYEVREGTFKQGEQQEYAINAGDRPLEGIPTFADTQQALEKLATLEEQRQKQAELADKKIEALQKKLQESQENLDGMEAAGEANTQEYKVASAAHDALNKDLNGRMLTLQKRRDNLLQPLSIQPAGMKMVTRQGFTVFENGAPKATFPTKDAAIDSVVLGLPDERLNEAAAGKLPSQRTVARKAQQELDRRQGKAEPGIKVKATEPVQKTVAPKEVAEKTKQMAEVLNKALKKFGLEDVGLKIIAGMQDEGSYAARLIKIALDADDPMGVLRHESIHALKDMGFFTPQQWSALERMAKTKWIDQYLKSVPSGRTLDTKNKPVPENETRFDAYVDIYGGNMNDVIEEAIADAFRDFDANKAPPGMLTALLKRMKDFFEALGNALRGLGYQTAEDIFGKVEAGLLKATEKPAEGKAKSSLAAKKEEEIDPNDMSRLVIDGPYANSELRVIESQIGKTSKPLEVDEVGVLFDKAYADEFKRKGDWKNPEDMKRATAQAVAELTRQIKQAKSGLDWYDEDIAEAFKLTQRYIPSLKKPEKRALFSVIAGIMSPSTNARDNWVIAAQAYQHYEKTGTLPGINPATGILWQGGLESANKKKQLDMFNAMLQPKSKGGLGEKAAVAWLQGDHTVAEINQFRAKYGGMGKSSVGGKMSDILPGFTMFGPKVGPFVMNINGLHEVTVDVWLTRTFNRYFGQMIGPDGKMLRAPTEPQRVAIKKLVNDAAGQLGIKPYQVQSVLWFFEQNLFNKLGTGAKSYGFSDGAIKFIESQGGVGTAKGSPANIGTDETADRTAREQAVGVGVQAGKPSIRTTEQGVTGEAIRSGKPSIRPGDQGGRGITESDRARQRGDRSGRGSRRGFAPLAGAPVVQGATGPDPEIVKVAEAYAAKNNIPYVPQATYVEIDEDRAKRLAQAYEDMPHAPQDPEVKAAYKDLIQQTKAQYDALVDAGYEFTFFDSNTDPYDGNPWNAMRDLRQNKRMAVYGTYDGYGTEGITDSEVEGNPMLEDTGLRWKDQNGDEQIVTANDLFRAVHDAFGHGIEGAGFRARGEENAWQAHARLFTGPALGAITSETRGQNSWLNYGPYGDKNKTAKLEDTVFAEQKTGLMPEWTWTEGLAESEGIVLGEMQPGAASFKGTHYGNAKVDTLNGDKYGTGIRGAERRRVEEGWDDRIRRRVYFYIPKPDGTTPIPEAGLGQYVYTQKFDNILPQGEVMSKLYSQANGKPNEFESAIVDAGYDGYAIPEMGMMVILNHNTPVNYQGTRAEQLAKKSLRSNLFVKRLNNVGIKDVDDFWNRWQNLLIGSGTSRPGLSGVASKISRQDDIKQTVSVWKADVERHGMRKYLHKYLNNNGQKDKDDDIVTSNIARKILESAGIKPTLKNVVWAYNSLPGHVVAANDENLIKSIPDDYDQESIFKAAPYRRFPKTGKNWTTGEEIVEPEAANEKYSLRTPPKSPEFQAYMAGSKMVDEDGNPQVWYHGTARNISIFRPKQAASIFLTQDPDFAAGFSEDSLNWMAKNAADELTAEQKARAIDDAVAKVQKDYDFIQKDDPDYRKLTKQKNDVISELENNSFSKRKMGDEAKDYLMQASKEYFPSGPNIMPLYVRAVKPFDFANKEHLDMVMRKAQEYFDMSKMEFPEKFLIGKKGLISRGLWQAIEAEPVQKAIRALGFDSYFIKEGGIKNLAVYSPAQVVSATGNIGAFRQRTPTFDEALNLGMTREEAIEAQKAGDIRLSLRGKKLDQSTLDAVNRITYAREEKGWVKRFTDALHNTSLRQAFVDRYDTIYENTKRVAASKGEAQLFADVSAHSAALLSDQAAGVAAQAMGLNNRSGGIPIYKNGGTFIFNDNGKIKGPLEIFKPLAAYGDPEVYRHYQFWAGSKRGARLMADGKEHLYTPADIREAQKIEREYPEFVTIQKEWDTYNRGLVNYMIDTGVISRSSGMEWMKYGDYIPFYRQLDGTPTVGPKVFQALSGVKAPKTLKGGQDQLGDFLENVVRNTQAAIESGMKNVAAQRVIRDALFLREAKKMEGPFKADINTVSVLENGKQVNYHLADAMLAEAMKGLRMAEIPFLAIAAAPANLLRSVVTKMPDFIGANLMRDSLSAYVTSGAKLTPVIDTIRNFGAAIADKSPALETLRSYGVIGGYDLAQNVEKSGRDLAKDLRKKTGTQTKKEKILSATGIVPLWEALEKGSAASDAATRMAVFEATMKETGNEVEAAFRAMEVMNFSRILTAITPFLNARIQGLDVLYRAGIRPILRGATPTEQEKAIAKSFYIRGMTLASLSVMYYMLTHDDDDYKKQEQETRDNNWLIPSLGVKIPIPFEVGVIFKVVPERITAYMLGNDTGQDLMQSAKRNLTSTFGIQPPQAILPVLETITNYSFFTGREIVGQGMQDIDKQFQVNPNTTKLAQAIGNLTSFKTATGKSWGVSPIEIDHLISGYLGGLGMYMADAIDTVIDMNSDIPKASKRFEQMPVIKRFALDPKARGSVTAYYDLKNAVDETVRTDNYLTRTMKMDAKGEYMQDYAGLLLTKDYVNSLEKSMKEFREMKTMIQNSPMSADDKRDALSAVIDAENSLTANIKDIRKAIQ
jgi:hypothetical protein